MKHSEEKIFFSTKCRYFCNFAYYLPHEGAGDVSKHRLCEKFLSICHRETCIHCAPSHVLSIYPKQNNSFNFIDKNYIDRTFHVVKTNLFYLSMHEKY